MGKGVNALRSFRSCIDEADQVWRVGALQKVFIYMSYLVIYLTSQGMRSKPW